MVQFNKIQNTKEVISENESKTFKKCRLNNEFLCELFTFEYTNIKSKTKTGVSAQITGEIYKRNTQINIETPLNKCNETLCEFCCLSNNRCGTKEKCENSSKNKFFFNIFFIFLIIFFVILFVIKWIKTDGFPEQLPEEKLDPLGLEQLITIYKLLKKRSKDILT